MPPLEALARFATAFRAVHPHGRLYVGVEHEGDMPAPQVLVSLRGTDAHGDYEWVRVYDLGEPAVAKGLADPERWGRALGHKCGHETGRLGPPPTGGEWEGGEP